MNDSISKIFLQNFRAFKDETEFPLKRITLLYGQNSAGKSSIIKSLLVLQQSLAASIPRGLRSDFGLILSGDSVDMGSFATTVSGHDTGALLSIGVELRAMLNLGEKSVDSVRIKWAASSIPSRFSVFLMIADRELLFHSLPGSGGQEMLFYLDGESVSRWCDLVVGDDMFSQNDNVIANLRLGMGFVPVFAGGLLPGRVVGTALVTPGSRERVADVNRMDDDGDGDDTYADLSWSGWGKTKKNWDMFASSVWRTISNVFQGLSYVGPLRREPQRIERYVPVLGRHVGASGEQTLSLMHENPQLVREMNNILGIMNMPYKVKVEKLGLQEAVGSVIFLSLTNQRTNLEVSPSDVGVGYSQVLPLIAQSVLSRNSLVCIEQPELHLHPAMQARLGDMFIHQIINGRNLQFLIETHSESLMLRILRRIRDKTISASDVQVLYIDQGASGVSVAHELPIHENGEFLREWPNGFFDERLEEIGF